MTDDYREMLGRETPTVLHGDVGERWRGAIGVALDGLAQGSREALVRTWLRRGQPIANDTLAALGQQRNLEWYPGESAQQYRARVDRAWVDWRGAGGPQTLVEQLAAAGYPGAKVLYQWSPDLPVPDPPDWWSQFWVYFPHGTHTVSGETAKWGEFEWGDGTVWGPLGLTRPQIVLLRGIVRKWKPGNWICRGLLFGMQPFADVTQVSSFAYSATAGSLAPVLSETPEDGDVILAHCAWRAGDVTLPSGHGFVSIVGNAAGDGRASSFFRKRWGAGDTDSLAPAFGFSGTSNAVRLVVVRNSVASGDPVIAAASPNISPPFTSLMRASSTGVVSHANSLVLRFYDSHANNDHGAPHAGALLYGGISSQAGVTLSATKQTGVSGDPGDGTMTQLANGPSPYRASTIVLRSANTSIPYAILGP